MARKKKGLPEEHENEERWLVTYADMITLLMVLFIVLFSMAAIDQKKFTQLKASLSGDKAAESVLNGAPEVLDGGNIQQLDDSPMLGAVFDLPDIPSVGDSKPAKDALKEVQKQNEANEREMNNLKQAQEDILAELQSKGLADQVKFEINERGLIVTVLSDRVLFDSGSANIKPEGGGLLDVLGHTLSHLPNQMMIEGHTDSDPINTSQYPSNWELSAGRASSVVRYLVDHKSVSPGRVGAIGYADTRSVKPNDSSENKAQNRRVEIVILNPAITGQGTKG